MEWNKANTQKIIQLYEKHRVLWDETYGDYKNPQSRLDALSKIADEMAVDVETVRKKITCIRSQYFRELNKIKSTNNYKSSWYGFKLLSFLNPSIEFQELTNYLDISINMDTDMKIEKVDEPVNNDQSGQYDNCKEASTAKRLLAMRRKRKLSESSPTFSDQLQETCKAAESVDGKANTKDIFASFGEYVAESLRNLHNKRLQILARHQINNIIYNAEMSQFSNQFPLPSYSKSSTTVPICHSNPPSPTTTLNNSTTDLFLNQRPSVSHSNLNTSSATTTNFP